MPLYAPFNNAVFGETLFGIPPTVSIHSSFSISPIGYTGLQVDWSAPTGQWNEQILMRSSYGTPLSIFTGDGTLLLDETNAAAGFSTQYIDQDLRPGHFYYYGLFVFSTQLQEYILAGAAQGLVLTDYGFGQTYFTWMPEWYLEKDQLFTATQYSNTGPLERYLNLIGFEMDWIRSEIESMFLFTDIELVSGALLPYLGANYGMGYEPELGMTRSRVLVKNAVYLYKNRGTLNGVAAAGSAFTGYGCEVTVGGNLEIQLDDSAFDRSTGHWQSANVGTTLSLLQASTVGVIPQHVSYVPIPAFLSASIPTFGYLPPNAENVAVISAVSASSWSNLFPSVSPPSPRYFAAVSYHAPTSTVVLFGGLTGSGQILGDTWTFSGATSIWTQLSPATSPPARYSASFAYDVATTKATLFGGFGSGGPQNDTWEWNGVNWTQKNPAASPPVRYNSPMTYSTTKSTLIIYGGQNGAGNALNDTWSWNGTTWSQLTSAPGTLTNPPARDTAMTAYNSTSGVTLMFGGYNGTSCINETWQWNGVWTQLSPAKSPSNRAGGHMCYDPVHNQTILFGGSPINDSSSVLNDTWMWNGTTWTQLNPATVPTGRFEGGIAFDVLTGQMIMFGGDTPGANELSDTWNWTGTNWVLLSPGSHPSAREDPAMAYDPVHQQIVLFGGFNGTSTNLNDTWTWQAGNWTQKSPATVPSLRAEAYMAFDVASSQMIMFGGWNDISEATFNDTWNWDGTNWHLLSPANVPPARAEYSLAYNASAGVIVMYGGRQINTGGPDLSDTWLWNGTNWIQPQAPTSNPPALYGASLGFSGSMYLFGGFGVSGISNQTWNWNGVTWSQLTPTNSPPGRYNAGMVFDSATSTIIVFGGQGATGPLGDSWAYTVATQNWTNLSPAASPAPRYGMGECYDTAISAIVIFGGFGTGGALGETWKYTSNTWAQLAGSLYPVPRGDAAMAYQASPAQVVLFGGGIAGSLFSDTWTLSSGVWAQISTGVSTPQARIGATLTYDPQGSPDSVLFGGLGTVLNFINETWSWSGTAWTQLAPAASPTVRWGHGACYDPAIGSGVVLIFGGQGNSGALQDTWDWNGTTWAQITTAHNPPKRFKSQMVYDTAAGLVVMFGGTSAAGPAVGYGAGALNDTWTFNGTDWTQVVTPVAPSPRYDFSMVYDAVTSTVVLFGGQDVNNNFLSDIWSFNGTAWSQLPPIFSPLPRSQSIAVYNTVAQTIVLFGGLIPTGYVGDTWSWAFGAFPASITTCTTATATTLGIPVTQGEVVVVSAYFQPVPQATPVLQSFFMQIDWYGANGALLSSTAGTPVIEKSGQWTRSYVVGTAPANVSTFGRTAGSSSVLAGDDHMMDAEQVEINTLATPGPTPWSPPRDIQVNLLPIRRNLVINPQGLAGLNPWSVSGGTLQSSSTMMSPPVLVWPVDTLGGFVLTATGGGPVSMSTKIAVNGGESYSFSFYSLPAAAPIRAGQLTVAYLTALGATISTTSVNFSEVLALFTRGSSVNLLAPVNAATAQITATILSPAANEVHYIGALLFEPLAYLLPYFDANFNPFTDYQWEGVPNQSISDYYPALESKLSRLMTVLPDYVPLGATFSLVTSEQAISNAISGL